MAIRARVLANASPKREKRSTSPKIVVGKNPLPEVGSKVKVLSVIGLLEESQHNTRLPALITERR